MGLLKTLVWGREKGLRARIRCKLRRLVRSAFQGGDDGGAERVPFDAELAPGGSGVVAGGANAQEPPRDVTPPEGFEVVLHQDALAPGELTEVIIGGTAIAVCNVDGAFHAVSSVCPHAGGPLGDGVLEDHTLTCPYHGWSFDVRDGACSVNPEVTLPVFEVVVHRDAVCVKF